MTEQKSPLDQALDLFLYAPLGLALSAGEELPRLAEKGRVQATMARMVGQMAVNMGRHEAERALHGVVEVVGDVVGDLLGGCSPPGPAPAPPARATAPAPAPAPASPASRASSNGSSGPRPSADALAIPGYDSLAASQVVQRLAGLSSEELEAVRAYEEATRHRKTILTRASQLQSDAAS